MAIFMSDEQLARGMRELAEKGELVTSGWNGFRTMLEMSIAEQGVSLTPEQENLAHWAFWTGARCVFDALAQLGTLDKDQTMEERIKDRMRYVKKLGEELGHDPLCRPPGSVQ